VAQAASPTGAACGPLGWEATSLPAHSHGLPSCAGAAGPASPLPGAPISLADHDAPLSKRRARSTLSETSPKVARVLVCASEDGQHLSVGRRREAGNG
jgi:hypothetical protein